jgi:hypothetical protein
MATRAHSTPASAPRRERPAALSGSTMRAAKEPRRRRTKPRPALPGIAAVAEVMAKLWEDQKRHDEASRSLRGEGRMKEGAAHSIAADHCCLQALALEEWMMGAAPLSPADAVAQLMVMFSRVHDLAGDENEAPRIKRLADASVHALAILARHSGFDLARLGWNHLTTEQQTIARGEIPA